MIITTRRTTVTCDNCGAVANTENDMPNNWVGLNLRLSVPGDQKSNLNHDYQFCDVCYAQSNGMTGLIAFKQKELG